MTNVMGKKSGFVDSGFVKTCDELVKAADGGRQGRVGHVAPAPRYSRAKTADPIFCQQNGLQRCTLKCQGNG